MKFDIQAKDKGRIMFESMYIFLRCILYSLDRLLLLRIIYEKKIRYLSCEIRYKDSQ